ncbi:hypothetical protein [Gimesia chilikensis]|nr:hypothetical protein [Gimesia chilikensis]
MRSLIFNTETEEALLIEDNELAEYLESEMKRHGCRVLDPDELGWNDTSLDF